MKNVVIFSFMLLVVWTVLFVGSSLSKKKVLNHVNILKGYFTCLM